jgi:6-phosphogluconolactonase
MSSLEEATMRIITLLPVLSLAWGCTGTRLGTNDTENADPPDEGLPDTEVPETEVPDQLRSRIVFTMTNDPNDNQVVALRHTADGLVRVGAWSTTGKGTGSLILPDLTEEGLDPLVSEGALHRVGQHLLVVNAGSLSLSIFEVGQDEEDGLTLTLTDVEDLPGHPNSVTSAGPRLFVAMSPGPAGQGGVAQLRLSEEGLIEAVGDVLPLSDPLAHPARALLLEAGSTETDAWLVVTEVMNDIIDVWPVRAGQQLRPERRVENLSAGPGPFGMAEFGHNLLVTEAAPMMPGMSSISTYIVQDDGTLALVTDSLANDQSGTCWVQISPDRRFAYTTNTDSGTLSWYGLTEEGNAELIEGAAQAPGAGPVDASLSRDGKYLYVLLGETGEVAVYQLERPTGDQIPRGVFGELGLPELGAQGILAW